MCEHVGDLYRGEGMEWGFWWRGKKEVKSTLQKHQSRCRGKKNVVVVTEEIIVQDRPVNMKSERGTAERLYIIFKETKKQDT